MLKNKHFLTHAMPLHHAITRKVATVGIIKTYLIVKFTVTICTQVELHAV